MSKVILICGKMCGGKTTYAKALMKKSPAALLSADEITTIFFGPYGGAQHVAILEKTRKYLFEKSLELIASGIDVILDWGFWTKADRREAALFYENNNVPVEWHYVDTPNNICLKNLNKRNREIESGRLASAYYFPAEVAGRFWEEMFEAPSQNEMDIWHQNQTS